MGKLFLVISYIIYYLLNLKIIRIYKINFIKVGVLSKKYFIKRIVFRLGLSILFFSSFISLIISTKIAGLLAQISIVTIFIFSLYCDIKSRKITNEYFKDLFLFSFILNFLEIFFSRDVFFFLSIKLFYFFLISIISLILFSLSIIGGSDGKLFILIFSILPVNYLNLSFVMMFFLLFSIFFILLFTLIFNINSIGKNRYSFEILFNFYLNATIFKRVFIKSFFCFLNVIDLKKKEGDKYQIISFYLIYNITSNKFQILAHYRAPLVIVCIFSYYFTLILKIGI